MTRARSGSPCARRATARRTSTGGSAAVEAGLGDREDDVAPGDRDEVVAGARAVAPDDLDDRVGQRDEVALGGVEEVGQAAAVAVGRERELARDSVAGGLGGDAFVTVLHDRLIGTAAARVERGASRSDERPD